jgi:DNA-binding NarL/FixJ family response regulator
MARVLLADSQPLFNEALEALLVQDGAHQAVGRCSSSGEVVALAKRVQADLILLDADLGLSGTPPLVKILAGPPTGTKVVLLAAHLDVELLVAAVQAGAVGAVDKTSGTRVVLRIVEGVLAGEAAIPRLLLPKVLRQLIDGQRAGSASALARLSPRERQVLALLGRGWSNRQIGNELFISPHTVRTHVQNILEKLELHSRLEAATYAMRELDQLIAT